MSNPKERGIVLVGNTSMSSAKIEYLKSLYPQLKIITPEEAKTTLTDSDNRIILTEGDIPEFNKVPIQKLEIPKDYEDMPFIRSGLTNRAMRRKTQRDNQKRNRK